ncbi:PucR family transcriptional regulator [Pseudonocardia sp. T1-2H]|uniref:PucR family transcriptional regulator n=1 Tax=Pseudonocardia sp. T1-2H TaxID=3128899 RepID=UPI0040538B2A
MVLEGTTPDQVHRLLDRTLGPLLRYDRAHDSSLAETVECYFASGANPPATARELGVHVNTVYQRLDRVDAVLGSRTWREPAGALEMQIVLQLHQILTKQTPQPPSAWPRRAQIAPRNRVAITEQRSLPFHRSR